MPHSVSYFTPESFTRRCVVKNQCTYNLSEPVLFFPSSPETDTSEIL